MSGSNKATDILRSQKVNPTKLERAKNLRKQMTSAEKILWEHLRADRMAGFHFRRQQVIEGFIVDFYCHGARLVIEVDGGVHQQTKEYDTERDRLLKAKGLCILRIHNEEIENDLPSALNRIHSICLQFGRSD